MFKTDAMTYLLITEYLKRKPLFDDDKHRADALYKEISDVFHSKGYSNITAMALSNRMNYLANEFNTRYKLRLTGAGSDSMNWVFYDYMGKVFAQSAVPEPRRLLSFGSKNSLRIREK